MPTYKATRPDGSVARLVREAPPTLSDWQDAFDRQERIDRERLGFERQMKEAAAANLASEQAQSEYFENRSLAGDIGNALVRAHYGRGVGGTIGGMGEALSLVPGVAETVARYTPGYQGIPIGLTSPDLPARIGAKFKGILDYTGVADYLKRQGQEIKDQAETEYPRSPGEGTIAGFTEDISPSLLPLGVSMLPGLRWAGPLIAGFQGADAAAEIYRDRISTAEANALDARRAGDTRKERLWRDESERLRANYDIEVGQKGLVAGLTEAGLGQAGGRAAGYLSGKLNMPLYRAYPIRRGRVALKQFERAHPTTYAASEAFLGETGEGLAEPLVGEGIAQTYDPNAEMQVTHKPWQLVTGALKEGLGGLVLSSPAILGAAALRAAFGRRRGVGRGGARAPSRLERQQEEAARRTAPPVQPSDMPAPEGEAEARETAETPAELRKSPTIEELSHLTPTPEQQAATPQTVFNIGNVKWRDEQGRIRKTQLPTSLSPMQAWNFLQQNMAGFMSVVPSETPTEGEGPPAPPKVTPGGPPVATAPEGEGAVGKGLVVVHNQEEIQKKGGSFFRFLIPWEGQDIGVWLHVPDITNPKSQLGAFLRATFPNVEQFDAWPLEAGKAPPDLAKDKERIATIPFPGIDGATIQLAFPLPINATAATLWLAGAVRGKIGRSPRYGRPGPSQLDQPMEGGEPFGPEPSGQLTSKGELLPKPPETKAAPTEKAAEPAQAKPAPATSQAGEDIQIRPGISFNKWQEVLIDMLRFMGMDTSRFQFISPEDSNYSPAIGDVPGPEGRTIIILNPRKLDSYGELFKALRAHLGDRGVDYISGETTGATMANDPLYQKIKPYLRGMDDLWVPLSRTMFGQPQPGSKEAGPTPATPEPPATPPSTTPPAGNVAGPNEVRPGVDMHAWLVALNDMLEFMGLDKNRFRYDPEFSTRNIRPMIQKSGPNYIINPYKIDTFRHLYFALDGFFKENQQVPLTPELVNPANTLDKINQWLTDADRSILGQAMNRFRGTPGIPLAEQGEMPDFPQEETTPEDQEKADIQNAFFAILDFLGYDKSKFRIIFNPPQTGQQGTRPSLSTSILDSGEMVIVINADEIESFGRLQTLLQQFTDNMPEFRAQAALSPVEREMALGRFVPYLSNPELHNLGMPPRGEQGRPQNWISYVTSPEASLLRQRRVAAGLHPFLHGELEAMSKADVAQMNFAAFRDAMNSHEGALPRRLWDNSINSAIVDFLRWAGVRTEDGWRFISATGGDGKSWGFVNPDAKIVVRFENAPAFPARVREDINLMLSEGSPYLIPPEQLERAKQLLMDNGMDPERFSYVYYPINLGGYKTGGMYDLGSQRPILNLYNATPRGILAAAREELGHKSVDNPEAQTTLDRFLDEYITPADLEKLKRRYTQREGESEADWNRRITEELVVKRGIVDVQGWRQVVDRMRLWLKSKLGFELTPKEMATVIQRHFMSHEIRQTIEARAKAGPLIGPKTAEVPPARQGPPMPMLGRNMERSSTADQVNATRESRAMEDARQKQAGRAQTPYLAELSHVGAVVWLEDPTMTYAEWRSKMAEIYGPHVLKDTPKVWDGVGSLMFAIRRGRSAAAQAAMNQIKSEAETAEKTAAAKPEPLPVYDPTRNATWWTYLLNIGAQVKFFGGDELLAARELADLRTGWQSAAIKSYVRHLVRKVEESFYGPAVTSMDRFTRIFMPKPKFRQFMREALPTLARLNVESGVPGNWIFKNFWMRAGSITKTVAESKGLISGNWIERANPLLGTLERLRVGRLITRDDGQLAYQLERPMHSTTQQEIYDAMRAQYPEAMWIIDQWIDPAYAHTRITINGVKLPVFNRLALANFYKETAPINMREAYTPDVSLPSAILGVGRNWLRTRQFNPAAGTVSPGRLYETGWVRESGQVMDILSGFGVRTMQGLQEQTKKQWMNAIFRSAVERPSGKSTPEGWTELPNAMKRIWESVKTMRTFSDPLNFPETTMRLADDQSPEYAAFFEELESLKERAPDLMVPTPLVNALINEYGKIQTAGMATRVIRWWGRNWKAGLLLRPDVFFENRTDNYLRFLFEAQRQMVVAGLNMLSGGDAKTPARMAMRLGWGAVVNAVPGVRPLFGLNNNELFRRMVEEKLPPELFEHKTRLADIGREGSLAMERLKSLVMQGKKGEALLEAGLEAGPLLLEASGYSKIDIHAKQQFAFTVLLSQYEAEAARRGLRGQDARDWAETRILNASDDSVRRAVRLANRNLLNYEDTPGWMQWIARHPLINLVSAFPLFRYHFFGREISRAFGFLRSIHQQVSQKRPLTQDEWTNSLADVISYVTLPLMGYAAFSVAKALTDSVIAPVIRDIARQLGYDDEPEEPAEDIREYVGSAVRMTEDPDTGKFIRKPLVRELVTSQRINISRIMREAGFPMDKETDYWWHVKDYPLIRSSALMAVAAHDFSKYGINQGVLTLFGGLRDMFASLAGMGAAVKVPARAIETLAASGSGQPVLGGFIDPYSTAVPFTAYTTLQALNLIPFSGQADELIKWLDPVPRRISRSKVLEYDPGVLEALEAEGWTGLAHRLYLKGTTGSSASPLPPQGRIQKMVGQVTEPRRSTIQQRLGFLVGQNIKPIPREEYSAAIEPD